MLLALYFLVLTLLSVFLAIQAGRLKARRRASFRIYAAAFGIVFGYTLAELAVSAYHRFSWGETSFFVFDESGKTVHFDPIRGYILTQQPSRISRITNGTVEWSGWLKGNSQGFPSQTDFGPARPDSSTRRIAVFGDSFSAGGYLETVWPDRAQALAEASGEKLQVLNFSLSAVGLANWWSILTRLVGAQNYQLDGIVFVLSGSALQRKFLVAENHGPRHTWRYCPSWDPRTYPATVDQTQTCPYKPLKNLYTVLDGEFELAMKNKWPPPSELRPVLATQILDYLDRWGDSMEAALWRAPRFEPEQVRLIEDIRLFVSRHKLPVLVVFLPTRHRFLEPSWENDRDRAEAQAFAKEIGARFVDGSRAFADMQPAEARKLFFPYDGHWNQAGSDRFAKFMLNLIPQAFPALLQASR
jgi:hypothetical protein